MRLRIAHVEFSPLDYLDDRDRSGLAEKLRAERRVDRPQVFGEQPVLVGRGTVSASLPIGTFAWSFARGESDPTRERAHLFEMIRSVKRTTGRHRFRTRDIIEHDGLTFLRMPALVALADQRDVRVQMLRAALGFLDMLAQNPKLLRGRQFRVVRPLDARQVGERGPTWTANEDAALREVFAPRAPRPSKREWEWLLADGLHGERTRKAVLMRVERLELRKRRR